MEIKWESRPDFREYIVLARGEGRPLQQKGLVRPDGAERRELEFTGHRLYQQIPWGEQ